MTHTLDIWQLKMKQKIVQSVGGSSKSDCLCLSISILLKSSSLFSDELLYIFRDNQIVHVYQNQ